MFILAVTTIMIAATAVVASAATVNKNDADYKYFSARRLLTTAFFAE